MCIYSVWKTGPVTTKRPDDFDSARLKPSQRAGYKRERFLKFNNKVLRFFGLWDDRKSMFGDKHFYTINYVSCCNSVLQRTALRCSVLQRAALHCNTLQHTATHCNLLQHTGCLASGTTASVQEYALGSFVSK